MSRTMTSKGRQRARRFAIAPVLAALLFALLFPGGAQAMIPLIQGSGASTWTASGVQANGVFELDADSTATPTPSPTRTDNTTPGLPDDWDRVCHTVSPTLCPLATNDHASARSFDSEVNADGTANNASIFTGGGSKDPRELSAWGWKDASGGLPDKDNLLHAAAARYSLAAGTTNCPGGTGCELVYFMADRFDNSGDSQIGFWFFKNLVTPDPITGSFKDAAGNPAAHVAGTVPHSAGTTGDLLILSDFTQGGTQPTIRVFEWVGSGGTDGSLNLIFGTTTDIRDCNTVPNTATVCASVNPNDGQDPPWLYKNKSGQITYGHGEFYEGGVDLSSLGFANDCFSSFLAETRSSQSTTATLKDFVLGSFQVCGASLTTQTSLKNGTASFNLGDSVTDAATVHVSGGTTPPAPTGTVSFYVCGPGVTTCATSGSTFDTKPLSGAVKSGNDYTVTSTTYTPTSAGTYCFAASWPGDANYVGTKRDDGTNECFTVNPKQPAISTTLGTTGTVSLGTAISDTATLSGTAAKPSGSVAGGTITFYAYGPQADLGNLVCTGTAAYTSPAYPVSGNGTYPTAAQIADPLLGPASFTPTSPGQYNWVATYSGDSPNTLGVSSNCADEANVIISLQPTMTTAQRFVPNDSATVTVASGAGNLAGTVTFKLFVDNATCSGAATYTSGGINITTGTPSPGTPGLTKTVSSSNTDAYVDTGKTFSWLVTYTSSNSGQQNVTATCNAEHSSITIDNGGTFSSP